MSPHARAKIYAEVQAVLGRVMTPDERVKLDRTLDHMGVPQR